MKKISRMEMRVYYGEWYLEIWRGSEYSNLYRLCTFKRFVRAKAFLKAYTEAKICSGLKI